MKISTLKNLATGTPPIHIVESGTYVGFPKVKIFPNFRGFKPHNRKRTQNIYLQLFIIIYNYMGQKTIEFQMNLAFGPPAAPAVERPWQKNNKKCKYLINN